MNKMINKFVPPYVFWPFMALAAGVAMAFVVVVLLVAGSNPFTVRNVGTMNIKGEPQTVFHVGDVIAIKREVCSKAEVTLEFFPSAFNDKNVMIPLPSGARAYTPGCYTTMYGFYVTPAFKPGHYRYNNLVRYQTNWVGRDESIMYPPLEFEIAANAQ
ncbi:MULTISPECIES: hypothetical protein [Pseudomonas]|uniref:Uncharacterized protein n=1 Tax=Pseudomonas lutea TaxID=243924 RepID=A0A9X8MH84_9PSED|nr:MULTISPECIES: hypothetical protein [Pseudomonas]SER38031.1 hypothetical protein SAMN05216409_118122 [Pseudomonas lutea]